MKLIAKILVFVLSSLILSGCAQGVLPEKTDIAWYELISTKKENLQSGMFYVKTISTGTEKEGSKTLNAGEDLYYPIYFGAATFEYGSDSLTSNNSLFKLTQDEGKVPVLYKGDELIYINTKDPLESMTWVRFEDLGYSTGISGLSINETGRFMFKQSVENVLLTSSIGQTLSQVGEGIYIVTETFDGKTLGQDRISRSGTITGLEKGKTYKSDLYIGTQHFDVEIVADCRVYSSFNKFTTNDYVYTDNGYAVITIPEGLEPGYYMINGIGMFCYAGSETEKSIGITEINFNNGIEYQIINGEVIIPETESLSPNPEQDKEN